MNKLLALAGTAFLAQADRAPNGNKICISNMAGFDMNWYIKDMVTGDKSNRSKTYPID